MNSDMSFEGPNSLHVLLSSVDDLRECRSQLKFVQKEESLSSTTIGALRQYKKDLKFVIKMSESTSMARTQECNKHVSKMKGTVCIYTMVGRYSCSCQKCKDLRDICTHYSQAVLNVGLQRVTLQRIEERVDEMIKNQSSSCFPKNIFKRLRLIFK